MSRLLPIVTTILVVLCAVGTARAVPLGTGTLVLELQGSESDHLACSWSHNFANQTYDVFGVDINLSTDLGDLVCQSMTVAGLAQPAHCESYPDSSILTLDTVGDSVCLDPPGCSTYSFINYDPYNVTGSLPIATGSDVVYTADGVFSQNGIFGAPSIPGCPVIGGPVLQFVGTIGINAFQTQETSAGVDQTVTFPETTFFNPITNQEEPIDVGITFSQVTGGGTTTVTALSNSAAQISANFATSINGFHSAFLEITTTATVVPPIEICSSYADTDDDGFLDGTSPAIPEAAVSFMHAEGDPQVFVDRTSSRDPVGNVICALVDSLSPFAIVVRANGICTTAFDPCDDGDACTVDDICDANYECIGLGPATCDDGSVCTADVCVSPYGCTYPPQPEVGCNTTNGKALVLMRTNADDAKDQVQFKWLKGTSPLGDFGVPAATTGYTLCAFDAIKMLVGATVPAASMCDGDPCWAASSSGVKYVDRAGANEGVTSVKGKADDAGAAYLQLKARGTGVPPIDLAGIVYPVTVQVRTTDAGCWEQQFASGDQKKNDGALFKALHVGP